MQCPRCDTPCEDSQQFCHNCGMVLTAAGNETELGSYRLRERIGQGHAGTVYRGFDETAERDVAIKVLHQHVIDDVAFMAQLHGAAPKYQQLSHPNLASLLEIHESEHVLALVTELLQGCTLQQYLAYRGVPKWAEIHYIANGILDGLQAMHAQDVHHCNIKTSNVFLCDDGVVRLTDFVLGRAGETSESEAQPSDEEDPVAAHYTTPEITAAQSDLYAFGIILYRMATGHWPFAGEHDADDIFNVSGGWIHRSLQDVPAPRSVNPDMPDCLARTISTLLSPDTQQDRPGDFSAIRKMLVPLGQPVPPLAPEDDEGHARFSNIRLLQEAERGREIDHGAEEAELDAAGVPTHSLLWVFKIASENATGGVPLDLCSPPPLEPHVLDRLRQGIETVPPLPEVWHKVQAIFDDPSSSPHDLARVIEHDQLLVAQVLRLTNSVISLPSGRPVADISQAITRIGMETTRNLLLQNMMPALGGKETTSESDTLRIWFHSQAIAGFSRTLAGRTKSVDRYAASLFGLLHDIGKLIMLHVEDAHTMRKIKESIASGDSALKAEWDVLGYTHIDAGMMLALHWQLPPKLHRVIYFHHHPCWHDQETWPVDVRDQIMIVHMAHLVLQSMMDGEEKGGVWAAEQRTHVEGSEALLRHPSIHLPVAEVRLYSELQQELVKLKKMFPTLYVPVEEDETGSEAMDD